MTENQGTVGKRGPTEDGWDFYFCRVDGRPASIFLNFSYEGDHGSRDNDTLVWVRIGMRHADHHGMGSASEAAVLWPLEDRIVAAAARQLVYVGRLRNSGAWQLAFYGRAGGEASLAAIVGAIDLGGRTADVGSKSDPDWSYYSGFLVPDPERRQWIEDRHLVETLVQHGDHLPAVREVNHWAYFPTAAARDAFVEDATERGFQLSSLPSGSGKELPFGANVDRDGSVELDSIHETVMMLVELTERHNGVYDGWETAVVRSGDAPSG